MTKNFKREEFACQCGCGLDKISPTVVLIGQMLRDHFGQPVKVNSGCRCIEHNKNVGGTPNSQHCLKGDDLTHAADYVVLGVIPIEVGKFLNSQFPNSLGIGTYGTFVHVDDRMDMAYRWKGKY